MPHSLGSGAPARRVPASGPAWARTPGELTPSAPSLDPCPLPVGCADVEVFAAPSDVRHGPARMFEFDVCTTHAQPLPAGLRWTFDGDEVPARLWELSGSLILASRQVGDEFVLTAGAPLLTLRAQPRVRRSVLARLRSVSLTVTHVPCDGDCGASCRTPSADALVGAGRRPAAG